MEIITTFDYGQLDTETRIVVKQRTLEIKAQVKHSAHAIADIGEKLIDVRSKLPEGGFSAWLKAEFDWTKMTAYRFIRVAEQFGSNNLLLDNAAPAALYVLSDPSTSESIRQEFIEEAEAGRPVTHKNVKARKKTGGIPKTTIEPLVADTAPVSYGKDKSLRYGRKDSVRVESQVPVKAGGLYCLPLACDEATWRLIKRTFNDPVWTAQVLAAAATLSEREVAGLLRIERIVDW